MVEDSVAMGFAITVILVVACQYGLEYFIIFEVHCGLTNLLVLSYLFCTSYNVLSVVVFCVVYYFGNPKNLATSSF